ncbi:MAG: VIT1/CCC1 transporter family protein [bacterium]|nr:VIT1/CCC1 transporter family protein [bacterium]
MKKRNKHFPKGKNKYIGSIVLGMSDALVEITGTLAGLTFALQNTSIIALAGLITGIAASLSMASSEYLSIRAENSKRKPFTAAFYTGLVYLLTVFILVLPFFLFVNPFLSLLCTVSSVLVIIALFSYYVSITQGISFKKRFIEMAGISLSVAFVSFLIGYALRVWLGIH